MLAVHSVPVPTPRIANLFAAKLRPGQKTISRTAVISRRQRCVAVERITTTFCFHSTAATSLHLLFTGNTSPHCLTSRSRCVQQTRLILQVLPF